MNETITLRPATIQDADGARPEDRAAKLKAAGRGSPSELLDMERIVVNSSL